MKKAIIHIGTHKTGSTAIQVALFENAKALKEYNINYPLDFCKPEGCWCGQHEIGLYLRHDDFYNTGCSNDRILKFMENLPRTEDLLLSSETFCLLPLAQIHELHTLLNGFDFEILIYVRPHEEFIQSLYQTEVVVKKISMEFEVYFERRAPYFDYYNIAQEWSKVFGKDKIHIRRYDRSSFPEGNVVLDFCNTIESLFGRTLGHERWKKCKANLNCGLPAHALLLANSYRGTAENQEVADAIIFLASQVHTKSQGEYEIASPSMRRHIREYYRESDARLAREYLGTPAGENLFHEPEITQADAEWEHEYVRNGATLQRLALEAAKCIQNLRQGQQQILSPMAPREREERSGWNRYKSLHKIAAAMTPLEWAKVIADSMEGPVELEGISLPSAPAPSIRAVFASDNGRDTILHTAFPVYDYAMRHVRAQGIKPQRLLDFGCGWGLFTRLFLHDVSEAGLYGAAPWDEAIQLSRTHMPFACFVKSEQDPPLPFADNFFDVVFASSVFLHLSESSARDWIREIARVLRPDGILVATTLPRHFFEKLLEIKSGKVPSTKKWETLFIKTHKRDLVEDRKLYDQGQFVFVDTNGEGDAAKYGWAFLPEKYIQREVKEVKEMSLVEYIPTTISKMQQDTFVLKKS